PRYHCAPAVRDILRRAHALRSWLEDTLLAGLPVLVAVCTKEHSSPANSPPLLLDRLWLGALDQLSEWLATGEVIDRSACQGVATFLAGELPPD
ncbi:MAG TPA: hypothetical protein VED59_04745, partial [Acidimicrobiales bacterium]|nr:hypothetical protein [Acidimicrobiales bacterium]